MGIFDNVDVGKEDTALSKALREMDFSRVEERIMDNVARQKSLDALRQQDTHVARACEMFGVTPDRVTPHQRALAKWDVFARAYGINVEGGMK